MMRTLLKTFILLLQVTVIMFASDNNSVCQSDSAYYCSFFPMHIGDKWVYKTDYGDGDAYYFQRQIVKDTLDKSNNKWFGWERSNSDRIEYYSITDSFEVIYGFPDSIQNLLFKLNTLPNDKWLIYGNYEYGIVCEVDTIYDYGDKKVMKIDEWDWYAYQRSLWISSKFLETNLGLVQVWGEGGPSTYLIGSIIDGVVWGNPDIVDRKDSPIIDDFMLFQNYPNPFNAITNIQYSVPVKSHVIIKVYDICGKQIEILGSSIKNPGKYELIWDAGNIDSGIYFIEMISNNFRSVKKCLIVK